MAELAPNERLLPFLLDRITDLEPGVGQEGRDRRVISTREYREGLLRDLGWLLNAACHPPKDGLEAYPAVAKSVLNYGMPELAGATASSVGPEEIEAIVRSAIRAYEPRILPRTLEVTAVEEGDAGAPHVVRIEIRAEVWNVPMPYELYIRTEVDLETGRFDVNESSQGS